MKIRKISSFPIQKMSLKHSVLLIYLIIETLAFEPDYYWRDYFGKIPHDAILAGEDVKGPVYIGQGFLKDPSGLIVAEIRPGMTKVEVPFYGPKSIDKYIKILCGPQENFKWLTISGSESHLKLTDKHAVYGGHETGAGIYHIGRIKKEGELKIGKIDTWAKNAPMLYLHKNNEVSVDSYQVLINDRPTIEPRPGIY